MHREKKFEPIANIKYQNFEKYEYILWSFCDMNLLKFINDI